MSEKQRHLFFQSREKIREMTDFMNEKRLDSAEPDIDEMLKPEIAEMAYRRRNASRKPTVPVLASTLAE